MFTFSLITTDGDCFGRVVFERYFQSGDRIPQTREGLLAIDVFEPRKDRRLPVPVVERVE